MGHCSSKSSVTGNTLKKSLKTSRASSVHIQSTAATTTGATNCQSNLISIPPVINLQFQESPTTSHGQVSSSSFCSLTSASNSCPRQIIIKIQLAKMENGQHDQSDPQEQQVLPAQSHAQAPEVVNAEFRDYYATDANSNQVVSNTPILDLMLNRNYMCGEHATGDLTATTTTNEERSRTAGGSAATLSANYNRGMLTGRMNSLQINERIGENGSAEVAEYCEVLEESTATSLLSSAYKKLPKSTSTNAAKHSNGMNNASVEQRDADRCRRQKNRSSFSSFRRMLDPTFSKANKNRDRQEHNNNEEHSRRQTCAATPVPVASPKKQQRAQEQQQQPCCSNATVRSQRPASVSTSSSTPISIAGVTATASATPSSGSSVIAAAPNQLSIRTQNNADVIIPFSSPQFVVVCPTTSMVTVGRFDDNGISLMTTEIGPGAESTNITTVHSSISQPNGPIVHSQVDFVHCLVPDLKRIFNSSFYWGKMDRYEAERLLEGKPEGTFLLRDSAQEEYLFSVTFRKYERSLHARIEQSGHKFSFDCHDPCVFTAPTVTGLLEHYKDPSCVMFFEPMLTIPFHRKTPFSLQQLARATIVSHTTYDGISELELPMRLKGYLKEYHYKQKLRVKPCDETFFACT